MYSSNFIVDNSTELQKKGDIIQPIYYFLINFVRRTSV